ncbi:MAG: ribose ABC transporter [Paracoccaceae bacterium]|mgnify:CR=1 FL=1|nr:ribose ABC transporter [Paracoccaceae bacterium]
MLKGIDQRLSAEVVHVLMLMGHGDDLVICDVNHPAASIAAETTYGRLIDMAGCDIPTAARAILSLMPLDSFVPAPVTRMQVVGNPEAEVPVFARMQGVIDAAEGRKVEMQALERFAFYAAAKRAFAIIRTSDSGPYGCFILKKGVVDLAELQGT